MTNRGIRYLKVNSAGKVTNPFAASLTALKHTSRQNVVFEVISHSDLLNACILLLVAATRFNYVLLFTVQSSCRYLLTNFPFLFTCWQPPPWISFILLPRRSSVAHYQRRPLWTSRLQFKKAYMTCAGYNAGERMFKRSTVDVLLKIRRTVMWMWGLLFQLWPRFSLLLAVIPIKL